MSIPHPPFPLQSLMDLELLPEWQEGRTLIASRFAELALGTQSRFSAPFRELLPVSTSCPQEC